MKRKPTGFFRSFGFAFSGVWQCVCTQRNFRIHLCAGAFACWLGSWLGLDKSQWALLFLTIGSVLAAEALNSAIEAAVDLCCGQEHPLAKLAKDAAAGGVLLAAAASVLVAVALFWRPQQLADLGVRIFTTPGLFASVFAAVLCAALFILGGKRR